MKELRLRDLGRWFSGGTPPRDISEFWEGDLPWISAKDIDSTRLRDPTTFITQDAAREHSRVIPADSILLIVRGMALAHGLPVVATNREVAFNQDLRGLVCDPGVEPRYVYYALIGSRWRLDAHIDRAAHGTARVVESIYSERIQVPEPRAQRGIADFLDRECARIDELESELTDTYDVAAAELRHLVDAELRAQADRFGTAKLGAFASVLSGYAFPSNGFTDGGNGDVQLLRGINVAPGRVKWDDVVYWPDDGAEQFARFALKEGDVVLGMDRPWISTGLRVATITDKDLPALLLQRVASIRSLDDRLNIQYARLWLESSMFRAALEVELSGVSVPHISPDQIGSFRIALPSRDIQDSFVRDVALNGRTLSALRQEVDGFKSSLRDYRDALIMEGVTGKLPITV